eukprot:TRINITY_DN16776_c0_g2_i1.p1 TRINITY_DN16776_c0_g2~~TRINITY_DN16776_c0_g2_i1.p1  ORF type:complete len:1166 (+),score=141.52 TRINITY_DN16776_c0_g2_i1:1343-4840(+)
MSGMLAHRGIVTQSYTVSRWQPCVLLFDCPSATALATRILALGQEGLRSTSRTRDAAAWMLAKYFTRRDVTTTAGLQSFCSWTKDAWSSDAGGEHGDASRSVFVRCGTLQAWSQILKAAPRTVLGPVWAPVLGLALQGPSQQGGSDFKGSSTLRRLRVKVACRAALAALPPRLASWRYERGARSLLVNFAQTTGGAIANVGEKQTFEPPARVEAEETNPEDDDDDVPEETEEVIELLLSTLSDADTVVRWAAAKGIGRVTSRLSRDFGDQVLESLLDRSFSFRETDKAWHGGCLALAELTRRGLLLPDRLATVVPLVCQALHFEHVSGNFAVGQHVRDAACYVCWAFARAYAPDTLQPYVSDLATALLQVAVYDREINCRRAAAAAVQEHVGRQGTFPNGIDVVTLADYWTLSARRNAYLVVAPQLATFGSFRDNFINHLVDRKLTHQDTQIRLLASHALARLAEQVPDTTVEMLNKDILPRLLARALDNTASSAASTAASNLTAPSGGATGTVHGRHGAVVGVAALVSVMQARVSSENQVAVRNLVPGLEKARAYRGRGGEIVRQASCILLGRIAGATSWPFKDATSARYLQTIDECARHTADLVQVAAVDALKEISGLRFSAELCNKCVDAYIAGLAKPNEPISARRGFALCLGALPASVHTSRQFDVLQALCKEIRGDALPGGKDMEDPQTRQYAVLSLGRVLLGGAVTTSEGLELALTALVHSIGDYAVDRRGDVGSWVREVTMEVIAALLLAQRRSFEGGPQFSDQSVTTKLIGLLLQQGVEKIDRLREHAFGLLQFSLCSEGSPSELIELAYRRVCHGEAYDLRGGSSPRVREDRAGTGAVVTDAVAPKVCVVGAPSSAWPPANVDVISQAVHASAVEAASATSVQCGVSLSVVFDALVPFIALEAYRPSIARGLVVSVGGLTESTAVASLKALTRYMRGEQGGNGQRSRDVCEALLSMFDNIGTKDSDPEAKRLLAPLLTSLGKLFAEALVPEDMDAAFCERAFTAVRTCRDIVRLRSSIPVFVGLLRKPGSVRRKAMRTLLHFLGFSYPTVRQASAKALYIWLLQEDQGLDLAADGESQARVTAEALAAVSELITVTPWGTDDDQAIAQPLREIYDKLGIELPTGGRSIVGTKSAAAAAEAAKAGEQYADLVRDCHF